MNLVVLTPSKEIYPGAITSVKVPGISGRFEILKGHAPIVSALGAGTITVKKAEGGEMTFSISKGFVEVLHSEVALLVQEAEESNAA